MPKRTLYVDGEMPAISMQSRLAALVSGMSVPPHTLKNMALITPDLQPCPMPDLSTAGGQTMIEPFLQGVDMVVLDNIATLCRTGKENESQSWQTMQAWLLELRRRGMTVLLIHHAGKSGDQRRLQHPRLRRGNGEIQGSHSEAEKEIGWKFLKAHMIRCTAVPPLKPWYGGTPAIFDPSVIG